VSRAFAGKSLLDMSMEITFQANDDDYIRDCSPQVVIDSMKRAMKGSAPYYAHIWYGRVSSESPLLSFACFSGAGVYISLNVHGHVSIYVDSDSFGVSYPIHWGQDSVVIPQAYLMSLDLAERIIGYFCSTGRISEDSHWRDMKSLSWNLYAD
jgi:hypothetical protein